MSFDSLVGGIETANHFEAKNSGAIGLNKSIGSLVEYFTLKSGEVMSKISNNYEENILINRINLKEESIVSENIKNTVNIASTALQDLNKINKETDKLKYVKSVQKVFEYLQREFIFNKDKGLQNISNIKKLEENNPEYICVLRLIEQSKSEENILALFYNGISGATTSQYLSAINIYTQGCDSIEEDALKACDKGLVVVKFFLEKYLKIINA